MAGIIWLVFVVVIIFRIMGIVKKADKTNTDELSRRIQESFTQNSQYGKNNTTTATVQSQTRNTEAIAAAAIAAQKAQTRQAPKGPEAEGKKKSTTEILNEKAMEDQRQHQIEKRQHEMEERRIHGMLRYAGRHYPGDEIPRGMREVVCEYCNAENLVPSADFTTKYNCYFCREVL